VSVSGKSLADLAQQVGGHMVGDPQTTVRRVASIEDAEPGDITFLGDPRYQKFLITCKASAVVVRQDLEIPAGVDPNLAFIRVTDPYVAFAQIHQLFNPAPQHDGEVSLQSFVDPSASLGVRVTVYPHVYVGKHAKVGQGSVLMPGVVVGDGVEIGEDCVLHPNVAVEHACRIGNRVILHAGVVVGSDGFGYTGHGKHRLKIPQAGVVQIDDDVEIGANSTIDRATMGRTHIGAGTKIDNLVQLAHNVVVGEGSLIIAQAAVAGSSQIGNNVIVAGQVGVRDHVKIGDNSVIGPKSGIGHDVSPGSILSGGLAAAPHAEWLRVIALLPRLPKLWTRVLALERKVRALAGGTKKEV
jgi:UDP-3-O-[3-hydroxymyristoyl] glucosamine N-acyltransferase